MRQNTDGVARRDGYGRPGRIVKLHPAKSLYAKDHDQLPGAMTAIHQMPGGLGEIAHIRRHNTQWQMARQRPLDQGARQDNHALLGKTVAARSDPEFGWA